MPHEFDITLCYYHVFRTSAATCFFAHNNDFLATGSAHFRFFVDIGAHVFSPPFVYSTFSETHKRASMAFVDLEVFVFLQISWQLHMAIASKIGTLQLYRGKLTPATYEIWQGERCRPGSLPIFTGLHLQHSLYRFPLVVLRWPLGTRRSRGHNTLRVPSVWNSSLTSVEGELASTIPWVREHKYWKRCFAGRR